MKSLSLCIIAIFIVTVAQAGSVRPIKGVDVIVKKNPGNSSARTVTSDADGAFTVRGLEAGSYTLTFNPCPYATGKNYNASKSNTVTRFVIDNPGVKSISVEFTYNVCFQRRNATASH